MVRVIALYRVPADDAFQARYAEHEALCRKVPGLQAFRFGKVLGTPGGPSDTDLVRRVRVRRPRRLQGRRAQPRVRGHRGRRRRSSRPAPKSSSSTSMAELSSYDALDPESLGFTSIRYAKAGQRATIAFDRPEVLNAFDFGALRELSRAIEDASWDDAVRVIVLTGAGERAFCTGADLREQEAHR